MIRGHPPFPQPGRDFPKGKAPLILEQPDGIAVITQTTPARLFLRLGPQLLRVRQKSFRFHTPLLYTNK